MNPITLISLLVTIVIFIGVVLFVNFTRVGKNLYIGIFKNKKYVVCHLKHMATGFIDVYRVVPEKTFYTTVNKFEYNLNPNYSIIEWKGRLHYLLEENDAIPKYINRKDSKEEILQQAKEIHTALHTNAYDELFKKQSEMALILCALGLIIAIFGVIYTVYELSNMKEMLVYYINLKK